MARLYPPWEHEFEERGLVKKMLGDRRGGVFIDVGANVGVWCIDFAPLFDRVYAFEPWPEYAEQLKLNLRDYGVGNVEVIEAAAWDFNGKVSLGIGRVDDNKVVPGMPGLNVPTVGYEGVLTEAKRIDSIVGEPFRLLKIDVEGNAMHVLRGAGDLLTLSSGVAVIEVHNHGESHGVYLHMTSCGWKLSKTFTITERGDVYHAMKVFTK